VSEQNRILIFIDWFLPAYKAGGPIISVKNIINQFSEKFSFYIVTSDRDMGDLNSFDNIQFNNWINFTNKYQIIYLSPSKQNIKNYIELIKHVKPNKIYINSLFSYRFSILPIVALRKLELNSQVILAPRGMLGKGAIANKSYKKLTFIYLTKYLKVFKNFTWHASTNEEKKEITKYYGDKVDIKIAQNIPLYNKKTSPKRSKIKNDKLSLLFVSRISVKKNLYFLIDTLSKSKYKNNIELNVVGPIEDQSYFKKCKNLYNKEKLNVNFHGSIPHDKMIDYFNNTDIFVLPTHHENYGHVIIEALFYGMPVLISKNTPWRSLEELGVGYDEELDSVKFALRIDYFYRISNKEFNEISKNAISFATNIVNNKKVINDNLNLFLG